MTQATTAMPVYYELAQQLKDRGLPPINRKEICRVLAETSPINSHWLKMIEVIEDMPICATDPDVLEMANKAIAHINRQHELYKQKPQQS